MDDTNLRAADIINKRLGDYLNGGDGVIIFEQIGYIADEVKSRYIADCIRGHDLDKTLDEMDAKYNKIKEVSSYGKESS